VNGDVIGDGAWHYPEPPAGMDPALAKGVAFRGDGMEIELAGPDRCGRATAPTGGR
jgi:hypothetical protein